MKHKKNEPKHPITLWDESEGLMATERGKARAFLLPSDVVVLAEAADLEFHNRHHLDRFFRKEQSYEVNPGAHFAQRSLYRESEGFSEAIHERIMFLNFEHPDHARFHAEYQAWYEPERERATRNTAATLEPVIANIARTTRSNDRSRRENRNNRRITPFQSLNL